jgi:hypothetical protein
MELRLLGSLCAGCLYSYFVIVIVIATTREQGYSQVAHLLMDLFLIGIRLQDLKTRPNSLFAYFYSKNLRYPLSTFSYKETQNRYPIRHLLTATTTKMNGREEQAPLRHPCHCRRVKHIHAKEVRHEHDQPLSIGASKLLTVVQAHDAPHSEG